MNKSKTILLTINLALPCFLSSQSFMSDSRGIKASFNYVSDEKDKGSVTEVGMSQWSANIPAFYFSNDKWSLGGGLGYEMTELRFSDTSLINEDSLHSLNIPLFLQYARSDKLQYLAMLNPNIAGDYESISSDSLFYSVLVGARYNQSEKLKWLLGAFYSNGFDDDFLVPAIGFQWKIGDRSELVVGGPIIRYSHNVSKSFDLLLEGRFASNRWNTTAKYTGMPEDRDLRIRAYRLTGSIQWNFTERQSAFISIGRDFAREIEIQNKSDQAIYSRNMNEACVTEIGYRLNF